METSADISECRKYRYSLRRIWSDSPLVFFIMLNPSTADEAQDDPTIRRCISFAKRWERGGIIVGNLFALRSPYPGDLWKADEPIGKSNDEKLKDLAKESDLVVGAWGNNGTYLQRGKAVASMFPNMQCLGVTKLDQPKHPLYLAAHTELKPLQSNHLA